MQRLRRGSSVLSSLSAPLLKKKALNSWAAVQDTFLSTKDTFERHRVVFTVGTSIASVATAWAGYSIRHYHETNVDRRLESIEKAMKNNYHLDHSDIKKIVDRESSSSAACFATAATTLVIGYALGWRGGKWYANRKLKREQMKMLGQMKPKRWQLLGQIRPKGWKLQFLKRPLSRSRAPESPPKTVSDNNLPKDIPGTYRTGEYPPSCSQLQG
ncbi:uncharacterized protein LOC116193469 [Punica granatum]|uniref:Uncharacterized protein LOC116193469 n=2 Tax=Punica granatum TaxID=22663 RepID=A0A6P8C3F5_PUNGR|nr:uncharacterized protein LOC116193469 [Punica granatum]PKI62251.1 hypothetical protein CRG98_017385 [Punica granatum]